MNHGTRPLIALTVAFEEGAQPQHALRDAYVRAVWASGGMPLLVPNLPGEEAAALVLAAADGLLLTGGADPDPYLYGEAPHPYLGRVSPERDALEIPLARAALAAGLPILGICRGMQILNVAAGGTLFQDLEAQAGAVLQHRQQAPFGHAGHEVQVREGTRLYEIAGGTGLRVNSRHHQAVRDVAPGFVVSATAPDGVIEAFEKPDASFVLGVQWHPEDLYERDPVSRRLFRAFIDAAGRVTDRRKRSNTGMPLTAPVPGTLGGEPGCC